MDKRTLILVLSLFSFIVVGMFVFAYLKRAELAQLPVVTPPVDEEIELYPGITRIDAKHYIIDGVHTFAGEVVMPTPCDLLEVDAIVRESYPEQITLDFNVINNSEMCAQVLTNQRFMTSASATSREATVTATFMGRPVELNLIPAAEGELPEEFELFIKG
jgi:hypothetical protein